MQGWYGTKNTVCSTAIESVRIDMTAISIAYVNDGFVVAADGRSRWNSESKPDLEAIKSQSDTEQKIFYGEYKRQPFAYALSGAAFNKNKTFNLVAELKRSVEDSSNAKDLRSAVVNIGECLNHSIATARADGRIPGYPEMDTIIPGTIAKVFGVGYLQNQRPSLVFLRLRHEMQVLAHPQIEIQTPPAALLRIGSAEVVRLTDCRDPRFCAFYRPPLKLESPLQEAIEWARAYIDACCSPAALEVDPTVCEGIGGHIHAATITKHLGFQWAIPPIGS